MSYNNYSSSAGPGFRHERPGHRFPLYLPFSVSIFEANPGDYPIRVLMTIAETSGGDTLSFDAEIPSVLDLNDESKWSQVDARLGEATSCKRVFAEFPQTLNTSLKQWRELDSETKLQDVLSFLEVNEGAIPSHLRGSFLAIATKQAARNNEHSICLPEHRIGGNTFSQAQINDMARQNPNRPDKLYLECVRCVNSEGHVESTVYLRTEAK